MMDRSSWTAALLDDWEADNYQRALLALCVACPVTTNTRVMQHDAKYDINMLQLGAKATSIWHQA